MVNILHSLNSMMLTLYSSHERTEIVFFFCCYNTDQFLWWQANVLENSAVLFFDF